MDTTQFKNEVVETITRGIVNAAAMCVAELRANGDKTISVTDIMEEAISAALYHMAKSKEVIDINVAVSVKPDDTMDASFNYGTPAAIAEDYSI